MKEQTTLSGTPTLDVDVLVLDSGYVELAVGHGPNEWHVVLPPTHAESIGAALQGAAYASPGAAVSTRGPRLRLIANYVPEEEEPNGWEAITHAIREGRAGGLRDAQDALQRARTKDEALEALRVLEARLAEVS